MKDKLKTLAVPGVLLLDGALLLIMPNAAAQSARDGIDLCLRVVIPSLFPFLVLSSMLVSTGAIQLFSRGLEGLAGRTLRLGGGCAAVLAVGLIGGFPVGARMAAQLYKDGRCTRDEAQRLLAFCNNCGPAFVFGFAGGAVLGSTQAGLILYIAQVAGALVIALLTRPAESPEPGAAGPLQSAPRPSFAAALTQSVRSSFGALLDICAFVIFFAVLTGILQACGVLDGAAALLCKLNIDPDLSRALLLGLFEVSGGVAAVGSVNQPMWIKLALCSAIMGWSGLSVHCQVLSVTDEAGLSTGAYIRGKVVNCALTALVAGLLGLLFSAEAAPAAAGFATIGSAAAVSVALPVILLMLGIKDENRAGNSRANRI